MAPAGTLTVNGTSARVRAGIRTVRSAKVIQAPVSVALVRTENPPLLVLSASAPRSRTVSGFPPGFSTDTVSCRTVPGAPSA